VSTLSRIRKRTARRLFYAAACLVTAYLLRPAAGLEQAPSASTGARSITVSLKEDR